MGWILALLSGAAFATSGVLAKGLLGAGWSPAAAVTWRIALGALALAIPAILQMRGRWHLLRRGWPSIVTFGVLAVAGCQLLFFLALERTPVAIALMIEYLGIVLVVVWLWLRRGQRPRPLTQVGAVVAIAGLALVLNVFGETSIDPIGAAWAFAAAFGLAAYFIVAADQSHGLPSLALACGGLAVGAVSLLLAGALGLVPLHWGTADVLLAGAEVPWWVSVLALGLVAAAFSYATGVVASRRLGSKLASFVGLSEMMFAVVWAWLLLGELPTAVQGLGCALIFAGVILVKLDE